MQNHLLLGAVSAVLTVSALLVLFNATATAPSYGDNAVLAPHLPISTTRWVKMMIEDSVRYQPRSQEAPQEYATLFPPGGHLVRMGEGQQPHTIAMFHQLRCLDVIRRNYSEGSAPSPLAKHCINYLRQSILCLADSRLEPVRSPRGPRVVNFSSDYVCKDWTAVYDASEKNYRDYLRGRDGQYEPM